MTGRVAVGSLRLTLLLLIAGWVPDARATLISGTLNGVVTAAFGVDPVTFPVSVGDPASAYFQFDTANPELTVSMTSTPAFLAVPPTIASQVGPNTFVDATGELWNIDLDYSLVRDFLTLDFQVQNAGAVNFNAIFLDAEGYFSPGTFQLDPNRSRLNQLYHAEPAGFFYASSPVPEPSTLALTLLGLPLLWWYRKRLTT